ncbi:hypothetical protein [Psychrobacter sp. BI730]|uniref:hypothetical protein n=1 Tax=Psychrobacter TaxID=497 RepID=UPI0015C79132|nr:hypothetical protein [Psychrobacter sp. BI730]NYR10878.1 hypothetical protein [Psychrobacter sp. BI730]
MKLLASIVAAASLLFSAGVSAKDLKSCIDMDHTWGNSCGGSSESIDITLTNECPQDAYVRLCMEKTSGKWTCRSRSELRPNRDVTFYTCNATGNTKFAACTGGYKECGFPDPK